MHTHRKSRLAAPIAALLPALALVCLVLPAAASAAPDLAMVAKASESPGVTRDRIFTFDPTSGAFNPLVSSGSQFLGIQSLVWHPDGETIAFVGVVAGAENGAAGAPRNEIWTVRRTGGGLRRIAGAETIEKPTFSLDGKRIAYVARFRARSGRGCAGGGYAVAVADVARATSRRVSACFNSRLAQSAVAFVGDGRQVVAVINRREIIRVAASGSHRGKTRPPLVHAAAVGDRIAIEGNVPGTKSLWLRYDTGDSALLRIGARRGKLLPGDIYDVAPNGRLAVGNCTPLPEGGLCAVAIKTRKRKMFASPFEPDLSRDSLEFGFSLDSRSRRLVSFGYPEFGLDGLPASTKLCVRASFRASAACVGLPAGVTVADRATGIALWRPAT